MRPSTTLFIVLSALCLSLGFSSGCSHDALATSESGALSARPYFDVFQGENGDHYFHFSAANHEIILSSQGYDSRTAALNGLLSVIDNGELKSRFEVKTARDGEFYFNLKARNGRVIASSETYVTGQGADRAVEMVIRNVGDYLDYLSERRGARFDIFRGADDRFYFNLRAKNGAVVLSSQGYGTEAAALNGTFSVTENGANEGSFKISQSADGGYYFNLKAANGAVIATSEVYATASNARRAVDSIMNLLPEVDLL